MSTDTLTPEGARLLRLARDQILAHPDSFDMNSWDCGTTACIAGHVVRAAQELCEIPFGVPAHATRLLGFRPLIIVDVASGCAEYDAQHPLMTLFFDWIFHTNADVAVDRINAFLWQYGYPAEAIVDAPVAQVTA